MQLKKGKFVTVVAHADLSTGNGEILYVNPTSRSIEPDPNVARSADLELVVYDAAGNILQRVHPVLRLPASVPAGGPVPANTVALIQEDIPHSPGMASVALVHKGQEKSHFQSGPSGAPAAGPTLGPAPAGGNRLSAAADAITEEAGVTYTVLVQKEGDKNWHTIAVGKKKPDFELDRNQFPGAKKVKVKVLRTTGFEQSEISEQDVDLDY